MTARSNISGATLLEVVVASLLLILVVVGFSTVFSYIFRGSKKLADQVESIALTHLLYESINCDTTFTDNAIDLKVPGGRCNSTSLANGQMAPFLRLRSKTWNNSSSWLTGPLETDGSTRLGKWWLRVACSDSEQSLVIRAVRKGSDGNLYRDPVSEVVDDWESSKALVASGDFSTNQLPLCSEIRSRKSQSGEFTVTVAGFQNISLNLSFNPGAAICGAVLTGYDGNSQWHCECKNSEIQYDNYKITFRGHRTDDPNAADCRYNYLIVGTQ